MNEPPFSPFINCAPYTFINLVANTDVDQRGERNFALFFEEAVVESLLAVLKTYPNIGLGARVNSDGAAARYRGGNDRQTNHLTLHAEEEELLDALFEWANIWRKEKGTPILFDPARIKIPLTAKEDGRLEDLINKSVRMRLKNGETFLLLVLSGCALESRQEFVLRSSNVDGTNPREIPILEIESITLFDDIEA